jgi:hypothetical protein
LKLAFVFSCKRHPVQSLDHVMAMTGIATTSMAMTSMAMIGTIPVAAPLKRLALCDATSSLRL